MKVQLHGVWWRLAVVAVVAVIVSGQEVGMEHVSKMVSHVVEKHLTGCHLVLLTTTPHSPLVSAIVRKLDTGVAVVDGSLSEQLFNQGLWWDAKTTCRALIIHLDHINNSTNVALRQVEHAGVWKVPDTRVVVVGERAGVEGVLLNHSLRNTLHILYLAIHPADQIASEHRLWKHPHLSLLGKSKILKCLDNISNPLKGEESDEQQRVYVYRRCMYCRGGAAGIQLVLKWNLTSIKFTSLPIGTNALYDEDQLINFHGCEIQFMTSPHFPYMDYTPHSDQPLTTVTPRDSIDARIIAAIDHKLNFTYIMREEPGRIWGVVENGVFTGMMGRLQRQEADICTVSAPSPERLEAANFNSAYPSNPLTIVSLKPTPLPQHLVLIRPFAGEVWMGVLVGVVVWGLTLWALQRVLMWAVDGRQVHLSTALLYGWGALLEKPPSDPSVSISGQMLVGWWLVYCLIILTGFKSSLIAALTIQGKSKPIETLEDLVNAHGWRWGLEPWLLTGLPHAYFATHRDPVVQKIFQGIEPTPADAGMKQILDDGFSMISFKNYLMIMVASKYTDPRGYTPFHISKKTISITATFGWAFRIGAPFFERIDQMMQRLKEAGIIFYWIDDVIARRVKENRAVAQMDKDATPDDITQEDSREVVLGLNHLQGAFYLLFLGSVLATVTLLAEILVHSRCRNL